MLNSEMYNKAADMVESGWIQGEMAKNEEGCFVHPLAGDAKSWCLSGALRVVSWTVKDHNQYALTFLKLIKNLGLSEHATTWNDRPRRTKEQVVALLRSAATRSLALEGEQNEV